MYIIKVTLNGLPRCKCMSTQKGGAAGDKCEMVSPTWSMEVNTIKMTVHNDFYFQYSIRLGWKINWPKIQCLATCGHAHIHDKLATTQQI